MIFKIRLLLIMLCTLFLIDSTRAQDVYAISDGEIIFSWADLSFTEEFMNQYPEASISNLPARFSSFFHSGTYVHVDFSNNFGLYSGLALRNIGFISDEVLPIVENPSSIEDYQNFKIIRRSYTLGIPLALKIGSFDNNFNIFGGGEIEWGFHSKEKWWDSHDRSGEKRKVNDWFPDNIESMMPSVFGGIQFPEGINVKFKYYLRDFLNHDFDSGGDPNYEVSNLTRYQQSQLMYVSITWQILEDFSPPSNATEERAYLY